MGTSILCERVSRAIVVASSSVWIEGEALRQLDEVSQLPGMVMSVGLPDLHPGKGGPVGVALASVGLIYPSLVGSDVGCGMALWTTDLPASKAKPEKLAARMNGLDSMWDGDISDIVQKFQLTPTPFDSSLGTTGFGNHFIEVQAVHEVIDSATLSDIGVDLTRLCILVHTGSRGLGESILRRAVAERGKSGLHSDSAEAAAYLVEHDNAVRWAEANRTLCARRAAASIRADIQPVLDICHNSVEKTSFGGHPVWLHRKGAAPVKGGPIVIPGSRGDFSYLVIPLDCSQTLMSVAHGAGRKMARHEASAKVKDSKEKFGGRSNPCGGWVICGDKKIVAEEDPVAYKDVGSVVTSLVEAGLVRIIAILRPVVTFKVSEREKNTGNNDYRDSWRNSRKAVAAEKGRMP